MKIALITNTLDVAIGGGWARYSCEVARQLKRQGHEVYIFTDKANKEKPDTFEDMPVQYGLIAQSYINWKSIFRILPDALWLRKGVKGCDVVHTCVEHHLFSSVFSGKPVLVTAHGTYIPRYLENRKSRWIIQWFLKRVQRIVCISDFTRSALTEADPTITSTVFIPNGVDVSLFKVAERKKDVPPTFITVGALKPRKGQDVVVEALALLRAHNTEFRYLVVGDQRATDFKRNLDARIAECDLSQNVSFVSDISDSKLIELYNTSFVCIQISQTDAKGGFEGFPLSLLEAAACGTPVIGTYGCGAEHLIKDGQNGYLIPQKDPARLAEVLRHMLEHPDNVKDMGTEARKTAEGLSWEEHAKKLGVLYNHAANKTTHV